MGKEIRGSFNDLLGFGTIYCDRNQDIVLYL